MNLQEAAKTALQVQDASNLSGVVRRFAQATEVLWYEARMNKQGTGWVNNHPIVTLFIDKLASLNEIQGDSLSKVMDAYDAVREIAEGK